MQLANDTCLNTQNRGNVSYYAITLFCVILFIVILYKKILGFSFYFRKLRTIFEILQLYLWIVNKLSYTYLYYRITKIMLNKASLAIKYLLFVFNLIIFVSLLYFWFKMCVLPKNLYRINIDVISCGLCCINKFKWWYLTHVAHNMMCDICS